MNLVALVTVAGLAGLFAGELRTMQAVNLTPAAMNMFRAVSYVLPNFENFDVMAAAAHGRPVPASLVGQSTVYAVLYGAVLLIGAALIFSRRNLK